MNYSKLASKLRTKIAKFSGYVSTGLDKTVTRFVNEAVYGIMYSQSVMLRDRQELYSQDAPDFKYHTLGDGLSAIFTRSPG
ncbi:MAG: hypothetical protein IH948_09800 [Bacteroidetes bacterium]|nr:hypothetical protein [Bacteroidota bacterium]